MSEKPISDLRRRMLEDMAVRKFGEKTRHDYIRHIDDLDRPYRGGQTSLNSFIHAGSTGRCPA